MSDVLILQRLIPDYRVAVYNGLDRTLRARGLSLTVAAGRGEAWEGFSDGSAKVPCSTACPNRRIGRFYVQNVWPLLGDTRLVICEHALAPLTNHLLLLRRRVTKAMPIVAFWGHGDNLQGGAPDGLERRIRRSMARLADHYFAYTPGCRDRVVAAGMDPDRVTVLNNSMQVRRRPPLVGTARGELRRSLGLPERATVALFCARLMPNKRISFVIDACRAARARVPDLHLVVVGDGPDAARVKEAQKDAPWILHAGARYGEAKLDYFQTADMFLLPSMVGLSILDGFAAGLPVLAADFGNHSPEVEYLDSGRNGLMTAATADAYADAIAALAVDTALRLRLAAGAEATSGAVTVEAMIDRFADGIAACLDRYAA